MSRGDKKIGTTGKGIGPAYADRVARSGVRLAELFDLPRLKEKVTAKVEQENAYLKNVLKVDLQIDFDKVWSEAEIAAENLRPFVGNVSLLLDKAAKAGDKIVFEGAQGTLLDQVHGTCLLYTSDAADE